MGMCCSKFGEYFIGGKDDDGVATNGAGATPKITKLSKKESVKETATVMSLYRQKKRMALQPHQFP